ncbi:AMP-binding protein [Actinomadura graeca]|uniref:AMP-binding protein n=1 Tax=Actinomadura graeca TaxID=2750812 RepID=A0ABX8QRE9_9ACTN|nr:AMP-binding protein [Actinomadura graeca]QXJ21381.1 AMP-binding protein [Actinomadura graeca]
MRLPSAHIDTFCRDNLPPAGQWPELLFGLPELRYPERLNCAEALLDAAVARHGADRPCLLTGSETWTYGDLLRRANQIAGVLAEDLGLVPGNRVLLRGPNGPWLVAAWFAVLKAGGVAVTTMHLLRAGEIAALAARTEPDLVVCDHRYTADVEAALPGVPAVVYGGGSGDDLIGRSEARSPDFAAVATAADDVALLAPTSGTTGIPKITAHFHRDVLAINDTFGRHVLAARPDDVFTGTPPLGFTFGLGGLVVFPLSAGAAVVLMERATPDGLADLIVDHDVTTVFTAPTMYRALLATGKGRALTSLRTCVSAGEHLPATVWRDFHAETGLEIVDGIGCTELLHIFISAAPDRIRPGSTGRVVPGFEAAVLDEEGRPVPDGVAGRLAVKGPTGCRYLGDDRQRGYVAGGWNITGDTYVRDADGYFWYQARSDDMIVSAGYKIAGPEVEQALVRHPDVLEAGVVGAPDPLRQMIVKAYVVLRDGASPGPEKAAELQDFAKRTIAPYKYPRSIEFVDSLPRTLTGKVQRYLLRESAAGQA